MVGHGGTGQSRGWNCAKETWLGWLGMVQLVSQEGEIAQKRLGWVGWAWWNWSVKRVRLRKRDLVEAAGLSEVVKVILRASMNSFDWKSRRSSTLWATQLIATNLTARLNMAFLTPASINSFDSKPR